MRSVWMNIKNKRRLVPHGQNPQALYFTLEKEL